MSVEPIVFENRLIVFSLRDNFARISALKIFKEYIAKLVKEGKPNITIFNLSEAFEYQNETFQVPVCEFSWPEKQAPPLEKLCSLCKAIDSWLNLDHNNIAIIYSKKDLSRSSLAIAVFLVYADICYKEAIDFDFESMSYSYRQLLESYLLSSQKRYIQYFKSLLSGETKINSQQFFLNHLVIWKIPNFDQSGFCKPFIKIYQGLHLIYCSQIFDVNADYIQENDFISFSIVPSIKLRGDILIKCYHQTENWSEKTVMFSFQFHTSTLTSDIVTFSKNELDIAPADKRFHPETSVELMFNDKKVTLPAIKILVLPEGRQPNKSNSYETFLFDNNANNNEVEYTKGPIDGSLYATIPKRTIQIVNSGLVTNKQDTLDQLLNDIFYEIQEFPEVGIDEENIIDQKKETNSNIVRQPSITNNCQLNSVSQLEDDVIDSPSSNNLTWLQKQQLKLKFKQDNKISVKRAVVEKKLFEELKHTLQSQNSSFSHKSVSDDIRTNASSQSPEVPARKSSKLLTPLVVVAHDSSNPKSVSVEDLIDECLPNKSSLNGYVRSSTPSFPVPNFSLNHTLEENSSPALFIRDTSSYWYKPHISREESVRLLRSQSTGTFIIRDSNSFQGAFGLAVKISDYSIDHQQTNETELEHTDLVRHFLIESTAKGVQIKGCPEEPVFSSLAALVYQHSLTRISLPTKLVIPTYDLDDNTSALMSIFENGAVCNVLYFTCQDVESLTGPTAIQKVIDELFETKSSKVCPITVHLKASTKGITMTDNSHKLFFRKHYPLKTISYFMVDPKHRTFLHRNENSKIQSEIFGFVAQKKGSTVENECLIFGHYEVDQPSHAITDFVNKLIAL